MCCFINKLGSKIFPSVLGRKFAEWVDCIFRLIYSFINTAFMSWLTPCIYTQKQTHIHLHTQTHANSLMQTGHSYQSCTYQTHTRTHRYLRTHTYICHGFQSSTNHSHLYSRAHTHTHTHVDLGLCLSHLHTDAHTHTHRWTHANTHTHIAVQVQADAHFLTCTHQLTNPNKQMHWQVRTHLPHTHTPRLNIFLCHWIDEWLFKNCLILYDFVWILSIR